MSDETGAKASSERLTVTAALARRLATVREPFVSVFDFVEFSDDFATWVFFYGPKDGEKA